MRLSNNMHDEDKVILHETGMQTGIEIIKHSNMQILPFYIYLYLSRLIVSMYLLSGRNMYFKHIATFKLMFYVT